MDRNKRRKQQAVNEKYGYKLYLLIVEYIQRIDLQKHDKKKAALDCGNKWKRIVTEAKTKKPPVYLKYTLFDEKVKDEKGLNKLRVDLFGIKPTILQRIKALF